MPYLLLALAIACEIGATSCLKLTEGFSRLWPSLLLGRALKHIPVSIAYAVWSGVGTAAVAAIGATVFGEALGRAQWLGIALIIVGVVVLNLRGAH